jgi:hypothetical protein
MRQHAPVHLKTGDRQAVAHHWPRGTPRLELIEGRTATGGTVCRQRVVGSNPIVSTTCDQRIHRVGAPVDSTRRVSWATRATTRRSRRLARAIALVALAHGRRRERPPAKRRSRASASLVAGCWMIAASMTAAVADDLEDHGVPRPGVGGGCGSSHQKKRRAVASASRIATP